MPTTTFPARQRWESTTRSQHSLGALAAPGSPLTIRYQARRTVRSPRQIARDHTIRAINVTVAAVGIVVSAPLWIAVAVLIKLTSRGPVIYKQLRVGLDRRGNSNPEVNQRRAQDFGGRLFTIYKFRTMCTSSESAKQTWSSSDDPRITAVGRFLRSTRLDELPQFINVLKGDMSIVGPRPEQPRIFADLTEEVRNYRRRQSVLPGITGLAQIELGYDQCVNDVRNKVAKDLEYIRRRSPVEDLKIMARTIPVMVFRRGWM